MLYDLTGICSDLSDSSYNWSQFSESGNKVTVGTLELSLYIKNHPLDFLCQLTSQSADIMSSLCGVGVRIRVRVRVNNFFSKTTRPRDMLFFLKDTLSIEN